MKSGSRVPHNPIQNWLIYPARGESSIFHAMAPIKAGSMKGTVKRTFIVSLNGMSVLVTSHAKSVPTTVQSTVTHIAISMDILSAWKVSSCIIVSTTVWRFSCPSTTNEVQKMRMTGSATTTTRMRTARRKIISAIPNFLPPWLGLPVVWDESRVLDESRIGELAAIARCKGDVWYLAVLNGEQAFDGELSLDFLPAGNYRMTVASDEGENYKKIGMSTDKIREGLAAGLFGCTIGGDMAVQDISDITGLTSRVTAVLQNHLFFPAQCLKHRRVATGLTQTTKIFPPIVLIPIQGCNSGMIAAMVDHVIVGHAERSKITTLLHIEDIGIPLTLGIFPVRLAVTPPEPVGLCSVGDLSQKQGSHFLAICVVIVPVKKRGHQFCVAHHIVSFLMYMCNC